MYFLITLIIALLGSLIIFIGSARIKDRIVAFFLATICYIAVGWFVAYFMLPSTAYPLFGGYWVLLIVFWIISAIISNIMGENNYSGESSRYSIIFPAVGGIIMLMLAMSGCEMINAGKYAGLIGVITDKTEKHWGQEIQPLDPTHIRLVPEHLAISLAKTALSQDGNTLGSQFPLSESHITLQKIVNDYWYLIPLDYKGYSVWTNANCVPGYVKVSATDPYSKPLLITGKSMKYTPEAFFGDNLERRLYNKYFDKILTDYSFEEDDSGNIYWVITVCSPAVGYFGKIVEGIILFSPETGNERFVSLKDLNSDPQYKWIDRVIPKEIVKEYINYWGNLRGGWGNSFWSHVNLLEAENPTMNYSNDGNCVFVTPITSTNENDQTMTGLMYTDARTGKFTYYTTSGGATEEAVIQAVNSAISYKKWEANDQIVYENVFGKLSALVPILGQSGNYQGLAIVENENKRVAVGANPQEALVEFQKMLMNSGGQITTESMKNVKEYTGRIVRLGWDMSSSGKEYYIFFNNFKNSFLVNTQLQSEAALTREGDVVSIRYINSNQAAVPTMYFKNLTLSLRISENEKSVINQMLEKKDKNQIEADVKDFKEEFKIMSDEQIKDLIKQTNK